MKKLVIVIALILTSCLTPPANYQFNNSLEVKDSYDNTWSRIVEFFARNNIQIKNIAKDSGLISAEKSSFDQNVADCGKSPFLQPLRSYGYVNVYVKTISNIQNITINTEFKQIALNTLNNRQVELKCVSTGNLERAIFAKAGRIDN